METLQARLNPEQVGHPEKDAPNAGALADEDDADPLKLCQEDVPGHRPPSSRIVWQEAAI